MHEHQKDREPNGSVGSVGHGKRLEHWCQEGQHQWDEEERANVLDAVIEIDFGWTSVEVADIEEAAGPEQTD